MLAHLALLFSSALFCAHVAIKYYKMSADKGFVYAQYSLGFCFSQGKGVPEDMAMAVHYYRLAAEQGHAASQHFLTEFYASIKDDTGAREGLGAVSQASSRDHDLDPQEMFVQAQAYFSGSGGCEQNQGRAVELFKLAAESGHAESQCKMGTLYAHGCGDLIEQQPEVAVQFFALAADQGSKSALYQMGNCFSRGIGASGCRWTRRRR
jgi:TPR repeat protein